MASELLLLGNTITADEAQRRFHLYAFLQPSILSLRSHTTSVNMVVSPSNLLSIAIKVAQQITLNSPDAVQSTKRALLLSQSHSFEDTVQMHVWSHESERVYAGANIKVRYTHLEDQSSLSLWSLKILGGTECICGSASLRSSIMNIYLHLIQKRLPLWKNPAKLWQSLELDHIAVSWNYKRIWMLVYDFFG